MYSFETLLHAAPDELLAILSATRVGPLDKRDARREQIAQQLGVKVVELVCAMGFNGAVAEDASFCRVLGYGSYDDLIAARNYAFIHDVYSALSINQVVEIYPVLRRLQADTSQWSDLVALRIASIEDQLEETINPILIGGYKLEIRSIYENKLADEAFVSGRLGPNHAVMRDMAGELSNMLEQGAIEPRSLLAAPGVSLNEKRRVVFQGLIPAPDVQRFINTLESDDERAGFREALEGSQA